MDTPTTPSDESPDAEEAVVKDLIEENLGTVKGGWRGY